MATTLETTTRTDRRAAARRLLRFAGHYLEMVVAMIAGMLLLDPLWPATWTADPGAGAVLMAVDMTVAMGAWMAFRRHPARRTAEMCAAMLLPFVVLLPLYGLGAVSGSTIMLAAHVAMFPLMLAAMIWRRADYWH